MTSTWAYVKVLFFLLPQALSVNLRKQTLDGASRNISRLNSAIDRAKVRLMLT
jgi:hypothetical protein